MSLLAAAAKAARRVYVRDHDGRFAEVPGVHIDIPADGGPGSTVTVKPPPTPDPPMVPTPEQRRGRIAGLPAPTRRDPDGNVILYHGTRAENVEAIKRDGLIPPTGTGPGWFMLTSSFDQAETYAHDGTVLEFRIPAERVYGTPEWEAAKETPDAVLWPATPHDVYGYAAEAYAVKGDALSPEFLYEHERPTGGPQDVRDVLRRFREQAEGLDLSTEEGREALRERAGFPKVEPRQEGRTGRPYLMPTGIPEDVTEGMRFGVAAERIRSDLRHMEPGRLDEVAEQYDVALIGYGRTEDGGVVDEDRFIADISRAILARQERERRARLGIEPLALPSHQDVQQMYEGNFGREGYAVQVDEYRLGVDLFGETFVSVDGTVVDGDGYHVGNWTRALFPTQRRVEHSMLELGTSHRGTGFAQGWNAQAEQEYARAGYTSIRLTAGKEDGPRVWAKAGYRFIDDYVPFSIENEVGLLAEGSDDGDSAVLWHLASDTTETNENDVVPLVQQASDLFDRMQRGEVVTPLEIADLGRDRPYVSELGSETVGEAILTAHGWRGEKDVLLLAPIKAATRTVRMVLEMLPGVPARGR